MIKLVVSLERIM